MEDAQAAAKALSLIETFMDTCPICQSADWKGDDLPEDAEHVEVVCGSCGYVVRFKEELLANY